MRQGDGVREGKLQVLRHKPTIYILRGVGVIRFHVTQAGLWIYAVYIVMRTEHRALSMLDKSFYQLNQILSQ